MEIRIINKEPEEEKKPEPAEELSLAEIFVPGLVIVAAILLPPILTKVFAVENPEFVILPLYAVLALVVVTAICRWFKL